MSKSTGEILRSACIIPIALAGLVHLLIAPAHYAHAPAHGIFFAVAGLTQWAWAVAFWRRPTLALYRAGLAVSGGLLVLWLLTLAWPGQRPLVVTRPAQLTPAPLCARSVN